MRSARRRCWGVVVFAHGDVSAVDRVGRQGHPVDDAEGILAGALSEDQRGHEQQRAPPREQDLLDEAQVDLGLAAARDALQ